MHSTQQLTWCWYPHVPPAAGGQRCRMHTRPPAASTWGVLRAVMCTQLCRCLGAHAARCLGAHAAGQSPCVLQVGGGCCRPGACAAGSGVHQRRGHRWSARPCTPQTAFAAGLVACPACHAQHTAADLVLIPSCAPRCWQAALSHARASTCGVPGCAQGGDVHTATCRGTRSWAEPMCVVGGWRVLQAHHCCRQWCASAPWPTARPCTPPTAFAAGLVACPACRAQHTAADLVLIPSCAPRCWQACSAVVTCACVHAHPPVASRGVLRAVVYTQLHVGAHAAGQSPCVL
jgi:hypothetical protein